MTSGDVRGQAEDAELLAASTQPLAAPQIQLPVLADEILAKAVMPLFLDQPESFALVNPAR